MAKIVLTDDHTLLRNGLASVVQALGHQVLYEADNGNDLVAKLKKGNIPELVLLDINMPEMDGYETARWLRTHYPDIKVLALSMYDNENAIIRMLKNGAKGYILKDSDPKELRTAIDDVLNKGFYYSELVSGKLIHAINSLGEENSSINTVINLTDKETEFLKYACTELTYKEIADKMTVSPRTIDHYRDTLFEKLKVKTRVGLVMYALKTRIVEL
ncbi:MAG TPA: response regulator transcription factor [Ferruginibacter sp.]|nr:response regulator transcription factor [Ferruginibacter sp.]HMP22042.1 response regulator transcription factor [Ferruginibacter sp.]